MFAQSLTAWRETFVQRRVGFPPIRNSGNIDDIVWSYTDSSPPTVVDSPSLATVKSAANWPVVVALSGVSGDHTTFFRVQLWLHNHGVRCIGVSLPADVCESHTLFVEQFYHFLDRIGLRGAPICLLGTMLGSYLAQCYAAAFPQHVAALVLCNAWSSTEMFQRYPPLAGLANWAPEFLLKRKLLGALPTGKLEAADADAIDFLVTVIEKLSRDEIVARLNLMCAPDSFDPATVKIDGRRVAVVVASDGKLPMSIQNAVIDAYLGCRVCTIKSNSEFLFIMSTFDELAMHIFVHLRSIMDTPDVSEDALNSSSENV